MVQQLFLTVPCVLHEVVGGVIMVLHHLAVGLSAVEVQQCHCLGTPLAGVLLCKLTQVMRVMAVMLSIQ
jgi:hypothetical protein